MVVHVITRIECSFVIPDSEGNAGPTHTARLELSKFDQQTFAEAFAMLQIERAKLEHPEMVMTTSFSGENDA